MPRPSQDLDQALLASGRALYPAAGCAGLSLRALAQHAGVHLGMFHYHFGSKDNFLRLLLQQMYDEGFGLLAGEAASPAPALQRLRAALCTLGRFVREHRPFVARVWADAGQGQPVARDFIRSNAPRHLGLLGALAAEAEAQGALAPMPAQQRLVFVMGAVAAPLVIAPVIAELGIGPAMTLRALRQQVLCDTAIAARVDLALAALAAPRKGSA
jgi:AcrR family transcriptional regulator